MNASAVGKIPVRGPRRASGAIGDRRPFAPRLPAPPSAAQSESSDAFDAAALANGLKDLMNHAQRTCRLRVVSPTVQVARFDRAAPGAAPESRHALLGLHTCKSPLCALCAPKWQRTRSDEISQAIRKRGADRVFFVTNTMRHHQGMPVSLMHRILTNAQGNLWSGSAGQAAARELGGKPESIRAHDRTWNPFNGWHPHTHSLFFVENEGVEAEDLEDLLAKRWPIELAASLKRFRRLCYRIVTRSRKVKDDGSVMLPGGGCGRADCRVCMAPYQGPAREWALIGPVQEHESRPVHSERLGSFPLPAAEQQGECPHLRERGERLFGLQLWPRTRRGRDGDVPFPIYDLALRMLHMLRRFTEKNIRPFRSRGVHVERMNDPEKLPKYLVKLGLELAVTTSKLGHIGSDGVRRYGLWEVGRIACDPQHEHHAAARKAWGELFRATFGTATITFSDREALGLDADPYNEDGEPGEADPGNPQLGRAVETVTLVGEIQPGVYRDLAREKGHGVLREILGAAARGELATLDYVSPPGDGGRPLMRAPPERGPPLIGPLREGETREAVVDEQGYVTEGPPVRVCALDPVGDAIARAELGDATPIGLAYARRTALPCPVPLTRASAELAAALGDRSEVPRPPAVDRPVAPPLVLNDGEDLAWVERWKD